MRNLGGAIGIALCATILNDRTNLHFMRLAEHLNGVNEAMLQWQGPGQAISRSLATRWQARQQLCASCGSSPIARP
jgi:DHA2 family multidrug resistance protein